MPPTKETPTNIMLGQGQFLKVKVPKFTSNLYYNKFVVELSAGTIPCERKGGGAFPLGIARALLQLVR